jgi:hypothetical protein
LPWPAYAVAVSPAGSAGTAARAGSRPRAPPPVISFSAAILAASWAWRGASYLREVSRSACSRLRLYACVTRFVMGRGRRPGGGVEEGAAYV